MLSPMQHPTRYAAVAVPPLPPSPALVPAPTNGIASHHARTPPRTPLVVPLRSPNPKPRGKPADDPLPEELKWDELRSLVTEEYGFVIGGSKATRKAPPPLVIEVPKIPPVSTRRDSDREGWDELSLSSTIPREASTLTEDSASNASVTARSEVFYEEEEEELMFEDVEAVTVSIVGLAEGDQDDNEAPVSPPPHGSHLLTLDDAASFTIPCSPITSPSRISRSADSGIEFSTEPVSASFGMDSTNLYKAYRGMRFLRGALAGSNELERQEEEEEEEEEDEDESDRESQAGALQPCASTSSSTSGANGEAGSVDGPAAPAVSPREFGRFSVAASRTMDAETPRGEGSNIFSPRHDSYDVPEAQMPKSTVRSFLASFGFRMS